MLNSEMNINIVIKMKKMIAFNDHIFVTAKVLNIP